MRISNGCPSPLLAARTRAAPSSWPAMYCRCAFANVRDAQLRFSMSKFGIKVNCFTVAIMGFVAQSGNGNHSANTKLLKVNGLVGNLDCDVRKSANFATVRCALAEEDLKTIYRRSVVLKRCLLTFSDLIF